MAQNRPIRLFDLVHRSTQAGYRSIFGMKLVSKISQLQESAAISNQTVKFVKHGDTADIDVKARMGKESATSFDSRG